jgi:hypothetical protein
VRSLGHPAVLTDPQSDPYSGRPLIMQSRASVSHVGQCAWRRTDQSVPAQRGRPSWQSWLPCTIRADITYCLISRSSLSVTDASPAQVCEPLVVRSQQAGVASVCPLAQFKRPRSGEDESGRQPWVMRLSDRALAGHLHHQQANRQARERGERAGRGGHPVSRADRMTGPGLDVPDVPRHPPRAAGARALAAVTGPAQGIDRGLVDLIEGAEVLLCGDALNCRAARSPRRHHSR